MRIVRHRLRRDDGSPLPFRRSPNQSAGLTPEYALMHFTAGASAESSIAWLLDPAARASAHVVVARDGSLTQLVAFDRRAWHAGRSRWEDREDLNRWSFGIELDNAGPLQRRADGWYTGWGARIDASQVVEAAHKHGGPVGGWHAYSPEQLWAAADLVNLLVRHYRLRDVIGHDDVAPGRKRDPGPAFPMESFRARVLGRGDGDTPLVLAQTTTALNIRLGPGTAFEKLAVSPLPAGTKLELLETSGAWYRVSVLDWADGEMDVEGWVHGRYVARLTEPRAGRSA
jgi:N-acetylmuramoyl-L-alanine amidase